MFRYVPYPFRDQILLFWIVEGHGYTERLVERVNDIFANGLYGVPVHHDEVIRMDMCRQFGDEIAIDRDPSFTDKFFRFSAAADPRRSDVLINPHRRPPFPVAGVNRIDHAMKNTARIRPLSHRQKVYRSSPIARLPV